MKTSPTAALVREHVLANPILCEYLREGLINHSQLARKILPIIRENNQKATEESVAVAIARLDLPDTTITEQAAKIVADMQVSSRSDVSLLSVPREQATAQGFGRDELLVANLGTTRATILVDTRNVNRFDAQERIDHLCALSVRDIHSDKEHNFRNTPGVISAFLTTLSAEGINLLDVFTGSSGIRFVIEENDFARGYETLMRVKESAHRSRPTQES